MCVIQKLMLDQHLWPMQSERAELVALNNAGGEEYRYPRATLPDERTASPITMGRKTKAKAAKKKNEKAKAAKAASGEFCVSAGGGEPFVLDGRSPERKPGWAGLGTCGCGFRRTPLFLLLWVDHSAATTIQSARIS